MAFVAPNQKSRRPLDPADRRRPVEQAIAQPDNDVM